MPQREHRTTLPPDHGHETGRPYRCLGCLPVCHQIVGTLQHFGFAAEMTAAYVEVARGGRHHGGIGVNGKATVYPH